MSSTTWTPHALASESRPAELSLWRAVEAQHVAATRALVDTREEQELLEHLLEAGKPAIPTECLALDYLLFTPFRYPSTRYGSRFRGRADPGVWYGADEPRTACAELGYWRCRFVADSAGLQTLDAVPHTLFRVPLKGAALDLRQPPFLRGKAKWMHPDEYEPCRALARNAREAGQWLIRYTSVRDPEHGACGAVLDCRAFAGGRGISVRQTWFLSTSATRATWLRAGSRAHQSDAFEFLYS